MTADGSYGEAADMTFEESDVVGAVVAADGAGAEVAAVAGADGAAGSGSTSTPKL